MDCALLEIGRGEKQTHWMWFIFPQLRGLGYSATAKRFGLADLAEASDYLAHPLLGPRLIECCAAMAPHTDVGAESVLGPVDSRKLQSCLTLFGQVPDAPALFAEMLPLFYGGHKDAKTLALLQINPANGLDGSA